MVPGLMQLLLPAASPSAPRQRLRWLASPDRAASSASLDNRATHVRNSRSVSALTRERARESRPPAERATPSLNRGVQAFGWVPVPAPSHRDGFARRCAVCGGTARRLLLSRACARLAGRPRACADGLGRGNDHGARLRLRPGWGLLRHRIPDRGLDEGPTANPAGDVVRIDRHGNRTHLGVGRLFFPSGFAAGSDGAIYVSNCSIAPAAGMGPQLCPTGGQVVRVM